LPSTSSSSYQFYKSTNQLNRKLHICNELVYAYTYITWIILQENKKTNAIKAFTHLKIVRNPKVEEPLPIPIELPHNYLQDVVDELNQNRLNGRARAKFITSILVC